MLQKLKSFLTHPLVRARDIDDPETTQIVSELIKQKPFLNKLYTEWYTELAGLIPKNIQGQVVELGSGGGFIKDIIPGAITSEILKIPHIDIVLDGARLPFKQNALKAIVMVDVLHHIPDIEQLFMDALFCLQKGGSIIMIEPWITSWSKFILSRFHHEPVETNTRSWALPPEGGPLSKSNQALPWIVFERDLQQFKTLHPSWNIEHIRLHSPFSYLLSGGVSLKSLLPGFLFKPTAFIEKLLQPCMNRIAMFATISLKNGPKNGGHP